MARCGLQCAAYAGGKRHQKQRSMKSTTEPAARFARQNQWITRGTAILSNTARSADFPAGHQDDLIAVCPFSALGLAVSGLSIALGSLRPGHESNEAADEQQRL